MKLVLVVDDDAGSREALALVLGLEGFAVETAAGAEEAVGSALRLRPAAVVCDLALGPGGDGCAVARAARAAPELAGAKLLALSGSDTDEARARAREAGFDAYLLKPVDPATLVAHLGGAAGA